MFTCLIPARGGSKSIPLKNIIEVNGRPLIWWTLNAAQNSNIDSIFVSTDSDLIKSTIESFNFSKVSVINRSSESSSDNASTEMAMIDFMNHHHKFDYLVLIQATSPLLKTKHINAAIDKIKVNKTDSLLSLVNQKNFLWSINENLCNPINYNYLERPRRQDHEGYFVENGAIYITKKTAFIKSGCRISGSISFLKLPSYTYFEVDDIDDIIIIEGLLKKHEK